MIELEIENEDYLVTWLELCPDCPDDCDVVGVALGPEFSAPSWVSPDPVNQPTRFLTPRKETLTSSSGARYHKTFLCNKLVLN